MSEEIIKTESQRLETDSNEGQEDYVLSKAAHKISKVSVDGKAVDFEVFLRLKKVPRKYGRLVITIIDRIKVK